MIDKYCKDSFFSITPEYVVIGSELGYDLYVNSSNREGTDKFVRIFPNGQILEKIDLNKFIEKYYRLYVPESQRQNYLDGLIAIAEVNDVQKTDAIKDSAIHYLDNLFRTDKIFNTEVLEETIKGCRDCVEGMVEVLKDYDVTAIQDLIGNLSYHDFYTYDHSINVSMYCISILRAIDPLASQEELINIGVGGLLHDLGKLKIPTEIINFAGKLTDEMFNEIKQHPKYGIDLMEAHQCDGHGIDLDIIKRVIFEHHENFNGTGYPCKIAGRNIHLFARITAVADFFDAITTKRSYHEALPLNEAIHLMAGSKGKKLDPKIFDTFTQNAKILVMNGKIDKSISDSFDPCQPHEEIPTDKIVHIKEKEDFGKIKDLDKNKKKKTG